MDFGQGIGYNSESNTASNPVPSRSTAVNSLRTGMMAQFKNNFVAASSNSQNQVANQNPVMHAAKRMALPGFVSGGTIGGEVHTIKTTSSTGAAAVSNTAAQNSGDNANQRRSEG